MNEKINSISQENINISDLDYMVREYLVHSGIIIYNKRVSGII